MDLREDQIPEENTELFPQAQEDAQPVQEEPVAKIAPVEAEEETVAEEPAQCEAESAAPQPDNAYSQEFPWSAPAFQQPQQADEAAPQPAQQPTVFWQEQAASQPQPHKESPFVNSPYVIDPAWQNQNKHQRREKLKKKRDAKKFWKTVACVAALVAVIGGACFATAAAVGGSAMQRMKNMEAAFNSQLEDLQQQIEDLETSRPIISGSSVSATATGLTPAQVYAMNVRSVVMIRNQVAVNGQTGYSAGSGFILTEDGYVVTNHHVIEGGGSLTVITSDGTEHPAKLIGSDSTNDVALLKIMGTGLPAVTVGSSNDLVVGDQVVAIGNPLGELTSTLTVGYVSAKDRIVTTDGSTINMIQTDAAINSGNSGGPLFNMKGEVVGITSAKYSGTSSTGASIEGIGFAIPMDDVIGMIEDLRDLGYVTGAYLGVMVRDVDVSAQYYGLPAGAYVEEVTPGYAAEAAGLKEQDIIIDLGGYEITCVTELTRMLRRFEPGETVSITVYRGGQELTLSITLDEKPRADGQEPEILMPGDDGFEEWYEDFIEDYLD